MFISDICQVTTLQLPIHSYCNNNYIYVQYIVSVETLITNVADIMPNTVAMDYKDNNRHHSLPISYYTELHTSTTWGAIMACQYYGHNVYGSTTPLIVVVTTNTTRNQGNKVHITFTPKPSTKSTLGGCVQ